MKVLHVINSMSMGGAEKLLLDTIPLFQQEGIKADLICLNDTKSAFMDELMSKTDGNIFKLSTSSVYNPINILKIIPFLRKYDIVHVHLFPSLYFTALAKLLSFSKVKLIFTEHNTTNRRISNPNLKTIERFIYSFYEKVICITSDVESVLIEKLSLDRKKLIVIENGVDIEKVHCSERNERKSFGYAKEDKIIIMVARFSEQKDQNTLIHSLKKLPSEYKLILVGDGEKRLILEDLVVSLSLSDRVSFLGNRSDVYSLIKMSDIAVLSSHWEGFGLVAVEAMACGIPLIASNVDGLSQVVDGGGILFEKCNAEDLKNKVLSLEDSNYYIEVRNKGINKASQYDIKHLVNKTLLLYEDVINN